MAIVVLHAITGVCTPACLLAASISVEAVTPPLVGLALKELLSFYKIIRCLEGIVEPKVHRGGT